MIRIDGLKSFCNDDICLIQNYEQAINDQTQTWECHHRLGVCISRKKLKELGCYWKRPASELIFLTKFEHRRLHHKGEKNSFYGKHHSKEARRKISEANKGKIPWNKRKHLSEETREKMSESHKGTNIGEKNPMYGKTGEKSNRSRPVLQIDKQTGEIIKTWPCAREVERVLGISHSNISACCRCIIKSAGGFVWRYVD